MRKYSVGSLFAGVGGICDAFKNSSCDVIWANEIDSKACQTYELNNTKTYLIKNCITRLSKNNLEKVDILTAGFPCQPFSIAGHGKGFDDERGSLFFEVVRLLKELQPDAIFLENVKTLATHDNGKTFNTIKQQLANAGYSFIPFILNAAKHTDIPQGRERIYIVGFKGEADYFYDKPIKKNSNNHKNCLLSKSFNIPEARKKPPKSIKNFLEKTIFDKNYLYDNPNNQIHKEIIYRVKRDDTVYQFRRRYVRENKSNVCPTLTANMGGGGHNIPIVLDGKTPRKLTPKECFNFQGFSKNFKLPDDIAAWQLYKQAGNSVVVPMVQKIAEEMVRVLDKGV